ncbi:MAG TPA: DUF1127 domain-containing protein [Alphaproteobacteria bacterium]|nr:DUF1127 domain-containing protein [Alphaproteobacteria bacterium]
MTATIIKLQPSTFGLGRIIGRLVLEPLARLKAREAAYQELMSLDDHMLKDIGITRSQIPGVVQGTIDPHAAVNENKPVIAA